MTNISAHVSPTTVKMQSSALIRFLSELDVAENTLSHNDFGERLGRLIGVSDSIALAAAHSKLRRAGLAESDIKLNPETNDIEEKTQQVRAASIMFINKSFEHDAGAASLPFPVPNAAGTHDTPLAYEPYFRLYATHQRELDSKVQSLRAEVRQAISEAHPKLAQLSALDEALDNTLSPHTRKLFVSIPKLLEKRFRTLQVSLNTVNTHSTTDPQQCLQPGGWLAQFRDEMKQVLLAEFELRLQPVTGMIKAFNKEVNAGHA